MGKMHTFTITVDKKETSEEDKKAITNIIHWTKQYFINTYDTSPFSEKLALEKEKEEKNKEKFINNALLSPRLFIYFVDT